VREPRVRLVPRRCLSRRSWCASWAPAARTAPRAATWDSASWTRRPGDAHHGWERRGVSSPRRGGQLPTLHSHTDPPRLGCASELDAGQPSNLREASWARDRTSMATNGMFGPCSPAERALQWGEAAAVQTSKSRRMDPMCGNVQSSLGRRKLQTQAADANPNPKP
jgi:hypothetical protein